MKKFKKHWDITKNWQFLFPVLGMVFLAYSSYKLVNMLLKNAPISVTLLLSFAVCFIFLKFFLYLFKKLENKWKLPHRWELIRVFLVFAITGSASVFISRPFIKYMGITKDNFTPVLYWILTLFIAFVFYQVSLVIIGWLLGQFDFFWAFEKKMLRRLGLKRFVD